MHIELWNRFVYKRHKFFNNAGENMKPGINLVWKLIHEDNTSLTLYSEVEKSITKATSEEKNTATFEEDKTMEEQSTNALMQQKSKKRKF